MQKRKVNLPTLQTRAQFEPSTLNEQNRTVEIVWTTGAKVLRGFWTQYFEELSMDPAHVRMGRMQSGGAPLLNSHSQRDLGDIMGVVERAWLDGDKGKAIVRFPKAEDDPEADKVYRKVKDGIIRNISVGYAVYKYEEQGAPEGEIPTFRAIDWEPMEVSLVAVPADSEAVVRNADKTFECELITKHNIRQEDSLMKTNPEPTPIVDPNLTEEQRKAAQLEAQTAERKRASDIMKAVRTAKLGEDFAQKLIEDGSSIDQARAMIIEEWARKAPPVQTPTNPSVTVESDEADTRRAACEEALLHRYDGSKYELTEKGREYAGLSLREMAREVLEKKGINTRKMNPMQLAERALHSTSDFPFILANVANKTLRAAYEEAPSTYQPLVKEVEVSDFKQIQRTQMGEAPQLAKVLENGEFTRGTVGEAKEVYQVETWGKIIGISRQVIINDDLAAFTRIPAGFGAAAKQLLADKVWAIIEGGVASTLMGDGEYLFASAHSNIATGKTAISNGLPLMREKLKKQVGLAGRYLNLQAKYLIVGVERENEAEKECSSLIVPDSSSNVNQFARQLQIISEPRLGATAYFLAADPSQIDIIEIAYLQGARGVYSEQRMGFEVDGLEIKARLDFGVKALDHRGLVYNDGSD